MRRVRGEFFILSAVLTFILVGPVWGGGMPGSRQEGVYTDYGSFLGEYQNAGALRFYENTEEMLRLAQFETALMRYRFLKGQIRRKVDYRGLLEMVDYRLRFLKKQLHLTNRDIAAIPPRRAWIPRIKPPAPPTAANKGATGKPNTPPPVAKNNRQPRGAATIPGQIPPVYMINRPPGQTGTPPGKVLPPGAVAPGVTTIPGATVAPGPTTPPGTTMAPPGTTAPPATAAPPVTAAQQAPAVVATPPQPKNEKAGEEKEEPKPPPKPLSFWDKLKKRLHLK